MLSGGPLAFVNAFVTYFVQISLAYLAVLLACALVRAPRIRFRAWAAVLVFAVVRWLMLCASTATPASPGAVTAHLQNAPALDWSWPVMGSWAPYLAIFAKWGSRLYLLVVAVALLQFFWTWLRLQLFLRRGDTPSPAVRALFEDLRRETKIRRCRLSVITDLSSPATAGWWHPRILLPAEVVPRLDPTELAHVLRHELMHVRRRDYLWDLFASVACRLVFFHPAAWRAYRRIRWERELSCDQAVVRDSQEVRLQYAECLAKLARNWYISETQTPEGIGLAASASLLTNRVRALLCQPSHASIYSRLSRACLSSAVVVLFVCLLPGVGLTLYWSAPLPSLSIRPRNASPAKRTTAVRRASQPHPQRTVPESGPAQPEIASSETLSSILTPLGPKALPVLETHRTETHPTGESDTLNPQDSSDSTMESGTSTGVWQESPPPVATAPSWQKVAIDAAVAVAATIGHGGGETQDGQSGQQGNH